MVNFRKGGIEDILIIQTIAHKTWPNTFEQVMSQEQIKYMLELIYNKKSIEDQVLKKNHNFIIIEKDNQPLGFTSYEMNYSLKPQLMIHKIYLLPKSQGLGIGKKLLDLLSGIAVQNANSQLRLKVFYQNFKAIQFYEKYGFKKVGIEITDIGNNYKINDNVMVKEL